MQQYRCTKCKKLLFEGDFVGVIEKICERCKTLSIFTQTNESQPPEQAMQNFIKTHEETAINPHSISKP